MIGRRYCDARHAWHGNLSDHGEPPKSASLKTAETDDTLMAVWWEVSRFGTSRWYLLIAAAGKRIERITLFGGLRREIDDHSVVIRGPGSKGPLSFRTSG